ncbi:hypothetical protein [Alsobacter soli]|uniref:hypothetical protein n=1 Tax=Alsobacter soli TaxID=2109933 RepID=UPI001FE07A56|nr:hypothetical protein [Alsobacter soli]
MLPRSLALSSVIVSALALGGGAAAAQDAKPAKPAAKPATASPAKPGTAPAKPAAAHGATGAKGAAAAKPGAKPAALGGGQPVQLEVFGDWGAYASTTPKGKVCYALAQPKDRLPKGLTRDPGYLFIATRPAEGVRNEVSMVLGYATQDGGEGKATIGRSSFALVTKGNAAWVKNAAEDGAFVEAMRKGQSLTIEAKSKRGNATTDRYALHGLPQALDRVKKECP